MWTFDLLCQLVAQHVVQEMKSSGVVLNYACRCVGWIAWQFVGRQMHPPQLYIALASVAAVSVVVALASIILVRHFCPRSRRIVFLRDYQCSRTKRSLSTPETVPLIVDKFVSERYRLDQQRYAAPYASDFRRHDALYKSNNLLTYFILYFNTYSYCHY